MGFYLFMGGLTLLMLFLIYYLFRLNRIGLSEKKQFQDKIGLLTREKMGLEEQRVLLEHQVEDLNNRHNTDIQDLKLQLEKMEKYRSLVEETEEFLFEMDHTGKFTYANPTMLNRLGYSESEIAQINYHELATTEQLPEIKQFYARQYHQKITDSYAEWQTINRFGESVWVGLRVHIAYNKEGLISSVKGIARDLSVQKEFERKEKEDNGFFEEIFQSFGQPVMVFRALKDQPMGMYPLFWSNESAIRLMDLDWFEIKGIPMESVSEELVNLVANLLEQPAQTILWQTRKNTGSTYQVLASRNKEWVWICLNDSQTLHQQKEKALNDLLFFKKVLDHLNVDVAVFSPDLRYQYINQTAVKTPELRNWMIGKTDEEYVKFRNKNLKKALFRQSKFKEVLQKGQPIEFDDFLLDGHKEVKVFMRQLIPVGTDTIPDWIVASGTNVTEKYLAIEKYLEALDSLRFTNRIMIHSTKSDGHLPKDSVLKLSNVENSKTEIFAGIQKDESFFLYPGALSRFSMALSNKSINWKNLDLEIVLPEDDNQLYFFPRALIELSLDWLSQKVQNSNLAATLSLTYLSPEVPQMQFALGFDSEDRISKNELLDHLETLAGVWKKDKMEVIKSEGQWIFTCNIYFSEDLYAGKVPAQFPILQGKKVAIAGSNDPYQNWVAEELSGHGAEVLILANLEPDHLSNINPHLLIWIGSDFPGLVSSHHHWIKNQKLKILWANDLKEQPDNQIEWVIGIPRNKDAHRLLEEVWIHCKPVSPQEEPDAKKQAVPLNFEKLLEITQGDKTFMGNLFQSYFTSLEECKTQFREHIQNADPEGMRFLLHKVRATINTFDIKDMEIFLNDSIRQISNPNELTEKKKSQMLQKVYLICESVENQIKEFAHLNKIKIGD